MTARAAWPTLPGFMSSQLDPLPSERLRVGQCMVDVALREIRAPAARRPTRVTPKSMGVLRMLVDHAGKVVSRDALLAGVWPDTLPGNDVVTQAVTQLRKAFGEARDNPQYIETIAKGGYRLLAEVEWLSSMPSAVHVAVPAPHATGQVVEAAVTPTNGTTVPPSSRQRVGWGAMLGAVAVAAVLTGLLAWWSVARDAPPRAARSAAVPASAHAYGIESRLITSSPGFELAPSLSPDASMVAYVAVPPGQRNIAVMVQTTTPTTPRQLTRPDGQADDFSPAWSPDGRDIAFLRRVPGQSCEVRIVSASGGAERVVGQCDPHDLPSFDWVPDGSGLIFGSGVDPDRPGLHLLDLASGELRALEYQASPDNQDFAPRYSPDGRWIVFVRNRPVGDFWRLPATGGTAERLTHLNAQILGWDWSPSGRALIYSHHHDNASRLYRLDLRTGARVELGLRDGEEPATATDVPALAYVQRSTRFGIYRFDLDDADAPGERLFASSGRDRLPAIAPDGRQLAFVSDRSGAHRLWWADVERPESLSLLDGVLPESRYLPRWSADSRRLLVVGRGVGPEGRPQGAPGVYELTPASGRLLRLALPLDEPLQAVYVPDPAGGGERVLVVVADPRGRLRADLFDQHGDAWTRIGSLQEASRVEVDVRRGRVLFARPGQTGLWQVNLQLDPASVSQVDAAWPTPSRYRSWTAAEAGGLYGIGRTARCPAQLQVYAGAVPTPPRCLDPDRRAATYGLSLDPRKNRLYVTLVEYDNSDIGFATYQPPADNLWPGAVK